ncbi:ankyrin repeat protein [Oesophagostomum dentatum]|uniref:Ankyrin repeat protein n=1 Tax=Oesophagostomum dentatum TaxID=61180 RepID=A0A0B1TC06_OESDE|nr:ankyrin repeat protein [Oesophagostomum dentatum]
MSCSDTPSLVSTTSIKLSLDESDDEDSSIRSIIHQHARDGNADAVEAMLNKRPDLVNEADIDGMTALHYAAKYGNLEVVELLLNRGADVDVCENYTKYTPLHMVAKYGRLGTQHQKARKESSVSRFIDASFRRAQSLPESGRDSDGKDVITAIIDLLVKYGAKVDDRDNYDMTPLHHAAQKNNEMGARALVKHGAKVNVCDF